MLVPEVEGNFLIYNPPLTINLQACPQGVGKARLMFFSVDHFMWVSGLRAFGVLWVFGGL